MGVKQIRSCARHGIGFRLMKTRFFALTIVILMSIPMISNAQENMKSYYCSQMGAFGQPPTVPQRLTAVITLWGDRTIILNTGTITYWNFTHQSSDGIRHYSFSEAQGMSMPNTNYQELLISSDYGVMRLIYVFGMPGMWTQMYQDFRYLGEGTQPAINWINGY